MTLETTIKLSKDTKDKLAELGKKGQTYDSIIQGLLYTKVYSKDEMLK